MYRENKPSRILWIDILRGIGILLVWLGHSGNYLVLGSVKFWLFSFHMPLFFFISGLLFEETRYRFPVFIARKADSLLYPYLTFSLISLPFALLLFPGLDPETALWNIIAGDGPRAGLALWFLPSLFLTETLCCGLFKLLHNTRSRILLLAVSAIAGAWMSGCGQELPWKPELLFVCLFFYAGGSLARQPVMTRLASARLRVLLPWLPILLVFSLFFGIRQDTMVDLRVNQTGNIFYFYAGALSGIFFWVLIAVILDRLALRKLSGAATLRRILVYFGVNSLIVLGLHQIIGQLFFDIAWLPGVAGRPAQILLMIGSIWLINRFMPFILCARKCRSAMS